MLRAAALIAAALVVCGCTREVRPEPRGSIDVLISVWRAGTDGPVRTWTLRCPDEGTLPEPEKACDRLLELGEEALAPVPEGVGCTQIYGGPQVAEVGGVFRGEVVNARFKRTNGCEIQRWDRVAFLFPTG